MEINLSATQKGYYKSTELIPCMSKQHHAGSDKSTGVVYQLGEELAKTKTNSG